MKKGRVDTDKQLMDSCTLYFIGELMRMSTLNCASLIHWLQTCSISNNAYVCQI